MLARSGAVGVVRGWGWVGVPARVPRLVRSGGHAISQGAQAARSATAATSEISAQRPVSVVTLSGYGRQTAGRFEDLLLVLRIQVSLVEAVRPRKLPGCREKQARHGEVKEEALSTLKRCPASFDDLGPGATAGGGRRSKVIDGDLS